MNIATVITPGPATVITPAPAVFNNGAECPPLPVPASVLVPFTWESVEGYLMPTCHDDEDDDMPASTRGVGEVKVSWRTTQCRLCAVPEDCCQLFVLNLRLCLCVVKVGVEKGSEGKIIK